MVIPIIMGPGSINEVFESKKRPLSRAESLIHKEIYFQISILHKYYFLHHFIVTLQYANFKNHLLRNGLVIISNRKML